MINEVVLNYILLFILFEVYEVLWQRAETILGMLARMHWYYSKSVFLFLIMHPTFYFSIGFLMLSDYNTYAVVLLLIKTIDIVLKILLIEQVFVKKEISQELTLMLLTKVNSLFLYIGLLVYPPLIFLAL